MRTPSPPATSIGSGPSDATSCRPRPRRAQLPLSVSAMRPIYTAVNEADAKERMMEFFERWADRYPAVRQLWEGAWAEFVPFLDYPPEVRRVIYSTNAIESLHARMRRATRARGHFPTEQAAMKCLYLVVRSLDPTGKAPAAGRTDGSQRSTRSPSPSTTGSSPPINDNRRGHLHRRSDSPHGPDVASPSAPGTAVGARGRGLDRRRPRQRHPDVVRGTGRSDRFGHGRGGPAGIPSR